MLDPNFVLDDDSRDRLITRFGPGVDAWCAALPKMVERYCLRWHLELDKALSGNGSRVFIGRQHGNRGVVLKLTPDRAIANEEAMALSAWTGTPHVVDLLEGDLETGALLLENIEPGTKTSDQPELPPTSEVAELLAGLREAAGYDGGQLPTLAQGIEPMFSRIGGLLSNPRISPLVTPQILADGHRKARELASGGPAGLLHGDLHLSNILRAGRTRGLVAIDPRPGVGDLTFDAIDWTLDRAASIDEVNERIDQLCKLVPDMDRDRLWRWCQATAAALAILRLSRRPPDDSTQLLLKLAAVPLHFGFAVKMRGERAARRARRSVRPRAGQHEQQPSGHRDSLDDAPARCGRTIPSSTAPGHDKRPAPRDNDTTDSWKTAGFYNRRTTRSPFASQGKQADHATRPNRPRAGFAMGGRRRRVRACR